MSAPSATAPPATAPCDRTLGGELYVGPRARLVPQHLQLVDRREADPLAVGAERQRHRQAHAPAPPGGHQFIHRAPLVEVGEHDAAAPTVEHRPRRVQVAAGPVDAVEALRMEAPVPVAAEVVAASAGRVVAEVQQHPLRRLPAADPEEFRARTVVLGVGPLALRPVEPMHVFPRCRVAGAGVLCQRVPAAEQMLGVASVPLIAGAGEDVAPLALLPGGDVVIVRIQRVALHRMAQHGAPRVEPPPLQVALRVAGEATGAAAVRMGKDDRRRAVPLEHIAGLPARKCVGMTLPVHQVGAGDVSPALVVVAVGALGRSRNGPRVVQVKQMVASAPEYGCAGVPQQSLFR